MTLTEEKEKILHGIEASVWFDLLFRRISREEALRRLVEIDEVRKEEGIKCVKN